MWPKAHLQDRLNTNKIRMEQYRLRTENVSPNTGQNMTFKNMKKKRKMKMKREGDMKRARVIFSTLSFHKIENVNIDRLSFYHLLFQSCPAWNIFNSLSVFHMTVLYIDHFFVSFFLVLLHYPPPTPPLHLSISLSVLLAITLQHHLCPFPIHIPLYCIHQ